MFRDGSHRVIHTVKEQLAGWNSWILDVEKGCSNVNFVLLGIIVKKWYIQAITS